MKFHEKIGIENIVADVVITCMDSTHECRIGYGEFCPELPERMALEIAKNGIDWDEMLETLYEAGEYTCDEFKVELA